MPKGKNLSHLNELLGRETTYSSKEKIGKKVAHAHLEPSQIIRFRWLWEWMFTIWLFEKKSSDKELKGFNQNFGVLLEFREFHEHLFRMRGIDFAYFFP